MARISNRNQNKDLEIQRLKKSHDKEKSEILVPPKDHDPEIYVPAAIDWKSLEKSRYDAPMAIKDSLDKVLAQIAIMEEDPENMKSSEYFTLLREASKHAVSLSRTIDTAIPNFYDPKESKMDIKREIIIKYEATNGVD